MTWSATRRSRAQQQPGVMGSEGCIGSALFLARAHAALAELDLDRHRSWIVGEVAPPPLARRAAQELVANLDGLDRVVVIRARPAHRELPAGGDQVAPQDGVPLWVRRPAAGMA